MTAEEIKELNNLEKDKVIIEHELEVAKNNIAFSLRHEMGQDIKEVISGNKLVKMPLKEKMMYKIKYYIDKFLNFF